MQLICLLACTSCKENDTEMRMCARLLTQAGKGMQVVTVYSICAGSQQCTVHANPRPQQPLVHLVSCCLTHFCLHQPGMHIEGRLIKDTWNTTTLSCNMQVYSVPAPMLPDGSRASPCLPLLWGAGQCQALRPLLASVQTKSRCQTGIRLCPTPHWPVPNAACTGPQPHPALETALPPATANVIEHILPRCVAKHM